MKRLSIFLFLFLKILLVEGLAEQPYQVVKSDPMKEPWRWHSMEAFDALNVVTFYEAKNGTMWFGNIGTIAKFDGQNLEVMKVDEGLVKVIEPKSNAPSCQGLVVVGEDQPVCIIQGSLVTKIGDSWNIIYKKRIKLGDGRSLLKLKDDSIWLLNRRSLMKVDKNLKDTSVYYEVGSDHEFMAFCMDDQKTLWLVVRKENAIELLKIPCIQGAPAPKSEWKRYDIPAEKVSYGIHMSSHPDGSIWITDREKKGQVDRFDPVEETWSKPLEKSISKIHALFIDDTSTVWLGGSEFIHKFKGENHELYIDEPWLPKSMVEQIFLDSKKRLWMLDRSKRIRMVDLSESRWSTYQGLHFQCEGPSKNQWFISHESKVISYNGKEWQQHVSGLMDQPAKLYHTSDGLIWAIGRHKKQSAFSIYNGTSWKIIDVDFPINISEKLFFESQDGSVWMGPKDHKHNPSEKSYLLNWNVSPEGEVHLKQKVEKPISKIYLMTDAPDGKMWLGGFALYEFDPASQTSKLIDAIPYRNITTLTTTKDGSLWVAQIGLGLHRFYKNEWSNYGLRDGLASNSIVDLLELKDGTLLAASKNGISRFDGRKWVKRTYPEDFYLVREGGRLEQGQNESVWVNITAKEIPNNFHADVKPFFSYHIQPEKQAPETLIDYASKVVPFQSQSFITWSGQDELFDFGHDDLSFSWRLNRGAWSDFSSKSEISFFDLSEGSHFFEVKARDRSFNIDVTPASVSFLVEGPIWKKPWFIVMILFFLSIIVALIVVIIKARERHLIIQQTEKEQHWKELDQIKTVFFSNVTHELRTPLTVVLSRLESLFTSETDKNKKNVMSIMLRNVNRISDLITQLLDFRKLEDQTIKLERTEGDIGLFIRDIVDRSKPYADDHQCRINCIGDCVGWFDPDKLDKIITNLISNAIKYSPEGGEIKVSISLLDGSPSRLLQIQVEDEGCGIEAKQLKHIFDRFYRISETAKVGGVGIGLNLTKELVNLWNGELSAQSPISLNEKRPGTRITVRLPIDKDNECSILEGSDSTEEEVAETPEKAYHILIVEDDPEIRSVLIDELGKTYQLAIAQNGKEGLKIATDNLPNLILTDLMMPDMNGLELCHQLKSNQITSHIPIMMLTAKSSLDSQLEGIEKGADDYMTKPFHMSLLKKKIESMLQNYEILREKFSRHYMLPEQTLPEDTIDKDFLLKVFSILEEEVKDINFDAEELAQKLHMSLSTLRRKLKAVTNDTPAKLIRDMRLKMGAEMLKTSDLTVTQIALEVGFSESNHFARLFKSFYKQTPTEYRGNESLIK